MLLGTTAALPAGTGPVLSPTLKTFSSDSNLRVSMGTRNLSSTSLQTPPKRPGEAGSEVDRRPGTAHSMRGSGLRKPPMPLQLPNVSTSAVGPGPKSPLERHALSSPSYCASVSSSLGTARDNEAEKPSLHIDLPNTSTTTFGGTPKSPLGQYELPSPLKSPLHSDTDSLLGDDPGKIVDEIAARITRGEKVVKPLTPEERRRLEADLEEQKGKLEAAKKKLETAKLLMACPSPPASIESEQDVLRPARKASTASQAPSYQEARLVSAALDTTHTPSSSASSSNDRTPSTDVKRANSSFPTIETPPLSSKLSLSTDMSTAEPTEQNTTIDEQSSPDSHMLRPQETSPVQTVPGANTAIRSPLFQQMTPFDIHSDEDYDEDEDHMVDYRAANAPYGLPSPPLSHHQRPSKEGGGEEASIGEEEEEGLPVLRTVQAKRDTTLVGAAGRTSLGLQIEEFEKSLQQAQAMSALENHRAASEVMILRSSRANSNASSAYSDLSDADESPMVLEPPLVSPKPFPLSPRPMGPRASTPATDSSSASTSSTISGRPLLEVRSESPFGSFFESFTQYAGSASEDTPTTPPAGEIRPRPRLGAAKPSRPTLGEYGPVKINTVAAAALAGRRGVQRPSLDEYDVGPLPPQRSVHTSGGFNMESPIIKEMPRVRSPGSMTDGLSSTTTSCTASPIGGVASYSVFSPPPPIKQRPIIQQPPRSTKPEWYGPAPSAPPTSPLPIPEHQSSNNGGGGSGATTPRRIPTTPQPSLTPTTPGLRTSPSIVPDLTSNPNWPLPAPSNFTSPPEAAGFSARRSLHRGDGRAPPPAPINIMATRYAEEVGGAGGPWTPHGSTPTQATTMIAAATPVGAADSDAGFEIRSNFSGWKEEPAPHQRHVMVKEENIEGIGLARGLSIKYDKIRERERRVRAHDQAKRMAIVTVDEEDVVLTPGPMSPLRRPNHGLKSPMGFADEQGVRFI